jgi:hypothetical protein
VGAAIRLQELIVEMDAIRVAFPDLNSGEPRPFVTSNTKPRRGRRRRMSAAERTAVSERMQRYWAARRGDGANLPKSAADPSRATTAAPLSRSATDRLKPRVTKAAQDDRRVGQEAKKR